MIIMKPKPKEVATEGQFGLCPLCGRRMFFNECKL